MRSQSSVLIARDACENSLAGVANEQNGSKVIAGKVTNRWGRSYFPVLLLLVIHCNATELLALRVLATRGDCATFAISRDHNATASDIVVGFPAVEPQRTIVDPRVRSHV